MIYAIDFDGVIHDQNPAPGYKMGKPLPGAVEAIKRLKSEGHTVIIHTVRGQSLPGADAVGKWLEYFDIPNAVWYTEGKPQADVYLDDKAVRFTSWAKFEELHKGE